MSHSLKKNTIITKLVIHQCYLHSWNLCLCNEELMPNWMYYHSNATAHWSSSVYVCSHTGWFMFGCLPWSHSYSQTLFICMIIIHIFFDTSKFFLFFFLYPHCAHPSLVLTYETIWRVNCYFPQFEWIVEEKGFLDICWMYTKNR